MSFAVLFPGQGSQKVGMGADLFDSRADLLGDAADEVLGWSLRTVCLDGPEEELMRTDRAQPALYALSYALWAELEPALSAAPAALAGHSLGEYTALAAAGSFDYLTGLGLVAARGRAMAAAAASAVSGMAALVGADEATAEDLAATRRAEGGALWVANINAPGQVVVAGGEEDVAWAAEHAPGFGVRRVVRLKVAGAFHTPFMEPAAAPLGEALVGAAPAPPRLPVWANSTAAPYGPDVAGTLLGQLTEPVRFAASLSGMAASGIGIFVHVGPGDVTAGLARKSVEGAETHTVAAPAAVAPVAAALTGGEETDGA
jgi:[acyl-carrier-protein] S-malonyltransferase